MDSEVLGDDDYRTAVHASHPAHQGIGGHRLSSGRIRSAAQCADFTEAPLVAQAFDTFPRVQTTLCGLTRQAVGATHGRGGIRSTLEVIQEIVPTVVSSCRQSVPFPHSVWPGATPAYSVSSISRAIRSMASRYPSTRSETTWRTGRTCFMLPTIWPTGVIDSSAPLELPA